MYLGKLRYRHGLRQRIATQRLEYGLAKLFVRCRQSLLLDQCQLHLVQHKRVRLPAHGDQPTGEIDLDLDASLGRCVELILGDGQAQETDSGLVASIYEGERSRNHTFHTKTCGTYRLHQNVLILGGGTSDHKPASRTFQSAWRLFTRRTTAKGFASDNYVHTGPDLVAKLRMGQLKAMTAKQNIGRTLHNERGRDNLDDKR